MTPSRCRAFRTPLGWATSFDLRHAGLADQGAGSHVKSIRQGEENSDAQVGRPSFDSLKVAQVLTGFFRQDLLGKPSPKPNSPHVGGDGTEEVGEGAGGHLQGGTVLPAAK